MAEGKRRVLGLVALWGIVMGGLGSASCYGHTCDGDIMIYGRAPGEGSLIDENTWESSPIDGDWIPYTKQRIWIFQMQQLGARTPIYVDVDISAEQNPTAQGTNSTTGSGNLAEKSGYGPGTVSVKNNTCADYYIRIVAHAKPRPPQAPVLDAGADPTDAATADAGD